jgi:hypothetical protein
MHTRFIHIEYPIFGFPAIALYLPKKSIALHHARAAGLMMFEMNKLAITKLLKPVRNFFGHDMRMNVDALHGMMICTMIRLEMNFANSPSCDAVIVDTIFSSGAIVCWSYCNPFPAFRY